MKKIFLMFAMALMASVMFGQTATIRLEMPATMPAIGEDFLVGVWLDEMTYTDPTIRSAIFGWDYDPAVMTPVATGPPFNRLYWNHNQMFIDYGVLPIGNDPAPGDLRIFFSTGQAYGFDPSFYGFVNGTPGTFKFFDLKFNYLGGDIALTWGTGSTLVNDKSNEAGGVLETVMTEMSAPDGALFALDLMDLGGGSPTVTDWTGAIDTDWFTAGNWTAGVPVTEDATILATATNMPTIGVGTATCGMITVEAGAMLTLDGGFLTAGGASTFEGDLYIMNDGSFIDNGTITGAGMLYFDRMSGATGAYEAPEGWHLISSPVNTYTNHDMYDYWVNTFDAATQMYVQHIGGFPCVAAGMITAGPVMGWSVKQDLAYTCEVELPGTGNTLDFDGAVMDINTGDLGMATMMGYNLVGNPYTSGIEAMDIVFDAGMDGTINTYNVNDDLQYEEWTMVMGSHIIAPTQGFFVNATAASNFNVLASARAHGGMFYKEELDNVLELSVTGNDMYDETFLRFMDGTSAGYDLHMDGQKFFAANNLPSLYTTSAGQQLAVDAQEATEQVPMSFSSETPGTYTIEAFETSDFADVYLQDLQTNTFTNLLAGNYEFNHTSGVQNFIIHFAPVGINDINENTVNIWAVDNTIMVNVPADVTGEIAVYNMMGQEVARTDIEAFETQIKVSDVNTNYVVKVISSSNTVTGKVYVK